MKKILQVSTLIVFIAAILISLLDLFGVLPIITNSIPYITLILLSALGAYLITEKSTKIDSIENKVDLGFKELLRHHNIPQIQSFSSLVDFYSYIVSSFKDVKSIHDVSWSNPQKFNNQELTKQEEKAYERFKSYKERILKKGEIIYNEIFTFPYESRVKRAINLVNSNYKCYNAVYYPTKSDLVPRMSFVILEFKEHKELLTFFYKNNSEIEEKRLLVKSDEIIELFQDYYDNAFNGGVPLKLGEKIYNKNVKKAESIF
ncbi:MAG: hypothetical protein N4A46_08410 [Schleiferiaceae bacterium]|jgi:hypothetical protein|nr:hypothetical protein [Schleiferiaceae bacterium]